MVITMTNEKVTVYDITEEQYEEALLTNNIATYRDQIIYECAKEKYVPVKMNIELGIGKREEIDNIHAYYYDNGTTMVKKMINDILSIQYYEDDENNLWPSEEYYNSKKNSVSLDYSQSELSELDSKLNRCDHIRDVLTGKKLEEFFRLYNEETYRQGRKQEFNYDINPDLLNSFYIIETRGKLIAKKSSKKLTSAQLEGCIYMMAAPAGMTETGEIKYFTKEYKITKQDTTEIDKNFRRLVREYGKKASELTDEERYRFLDMATNEYVKWILGDMNYLGTRKSSIISNETRTWNLFKATFRKEHEYSLDDYDDKWLEFGTTTIDSRKVEKGIITPLIIEDYQYKIKSSETKEEETEERKFIGQEYSYFLEPHEAKYFTLPLEESGDLSIGDQASFAASINMLNQVNEGGNLANEEMHEIFANDEEELDFSDIDEDIDEDLFSKDMDEDIDEDQIVVSHEVKPQDINVTIEDVIGKKNMFKVEKKDFQPPAVISEPYVFEPVSWTDKEIDELLGPIEDEPKVQFRKPTIEDVIGKKDMFKVEKQDFQPPAVIAPIEFKKEESEELDFSDIDEDIDENLFSDDMDEDIEEEFVDVSSKLEESRRKLADIIHQVAVKKSNEEINFEDIDEDVNEDGLDLSDSDEDIDEDESDFSISDEFLDDEDLFSNIGLVSYNGDTLLFDEEPANYSSVVVYTNNDGESFEMMEDVKKNKKM